MRAALGTSVLALALLWLFYRASSDGLLSLSPQGCRMSWMSPSYVHQRTFDANWTDSTLADRYSLWLYREQGWESELHGSPVLFIPGNAGSSHQVRSIASSSTRQYFANPYNVSPDFAGRVAATSALDFFAVDFNEDFSALHGPTLDSQTAYTTDAVNYILSLYPAGTQLLLLGHSMGGVVALSLLAPHEHRISAVLTLSTPHTLPPARFDRRIESIYQTNLHTLAQSPVPVLSLCGGATDTMIPSESCALPDITAHTTAMYRRTVFASALEGAWTGVGHREMVWCHQVRWRVARAALELAALSRARSGPAPLREKAVVLDTWLSDGHRLPSSSSDSGLLTVGNEPVEPSTTHLVLASPSVLTDRTWQIPVPAAWTDRKPETIDPHATEAVAWHVTNGKDKVATSARARFVMYLSQGSIPPLAPQDALPLSASAYLCPPREAHSSASTQRECSALTPIVHRMVPNPAVGKPFPVPEEGTDESEGIVIFEADVLRSFVWMSDEGVHAEIDRSVAIDVTGSLDDSAAGKAWLVAGFAPAEPIVDNSTTFGLLFRKTTIELDPSALLLTIHLPKLLSNVLLVYRVTPVFTSSRLRCSSVLFPPLLTHLSPASSEAHYHPLSPGSRPVLLHTHSSGPYISAPSTRRHGVELSLRTSAESYCKIHALDVTVDLWATLGRWGPRYWPAVACWASGIATLLLFGALRAAEVGGRTLTVGESIRSFVRTALPTLMLASFALSYVPLSESYYLGNIGQAIFAPIAPILFLISTGLVCISWWLLLMLMFPFRAFRRRSKGAHANLADNSIHRKTMLSMLAIFALIYFFVPWQVAFLGAWAVHLHTCGSTPPSAVQRATTPDASTPPTSPPARTSSTPDDDRRLPGLATHLLLVLTWLLPLAAPALAVWARTLATAGIRASATGDHNPLRAAPFLVLVDFASWTREPLFPRQAWERPLSMRYLLLIVAFAAFIPGPRWTYLIFDSATAVLGAFVACRIGARYWGSTWERTRTLRY